MRTFGEYRPTQFDCKGLGSDETSEAWLVAPCGTNRDADCLQRSNWESMVVALNKLDPECKDHTEHEFGHWACGWFRIAIVRPGTECAKYAESIESALSDYPVLDESHYSDMQTNEAIEYWGNMSLRERVELCQRCNVNPMAARHDSIPDNDCMWEQLTAEG